MLPASEYLLCFSDAGDYTIKVRFPPERKDAFVRPLKASAEEIGHLLAQALGAEPITTMTFDEHPFSITRLTLDVGTKILTIHCKELQS